MMRRTTRRRASRTIWYGRILRILEERYVQFIPKDGEGLRRLFARESTSCVLRFSMGFDPSPIAEYQRLVNARVDELRRDRDCYVEAILRKIKKAGRCTVFVLDNTDQLGEEFQKSVFLFSQKLSDTYSTLSIVALREEKFFAAYRQGVFDAYGTRKFHIGSPDSSP